MNKLISDLKNLSVEDRLSVFKSVSEEPKPAIPFSRATLSDCSRSDGLGLNYDNISIDIPTILIPEEFNAPLISDSLCDYMDTIKKVWVLDNEKACRILIDAILTEILRNDLNHKLLGFCEVKNDWEGSGCGYTGNVDYMLGSSKRRTADSMDAFLLVVEAKAEWPASGIPQTLCEAGCLLKKRLAAGKNTPVFAALTNGTLFRFFAIDVDGVVYCSDLLMLKVGKDGSYRTSTSLAEIFRWFYWFMTVMKDVAPRASREDLSEQKLEKSLARLQACFGLPSSSTSKSSNG